MSANATTVPLAYTTSIMSWAFALSALDRARAKSGEIGSTDLNLEVPSVIVLSGTAIEAFVNELTSLTNAYTFTQGNLGRAYGYGISAEDTNFEVLDDARMLREDSRGSFYDRYKRILKALAIAKPPFMMDLTRLRDLRNALVHFRDCDIPIIEDESGVIRAGQRAPAIFTHLASRHIEGSPIIAGSYENEGEEWPLRVSTNAMAVWVVELALDAMCYVLENLPTGPCRDFISRQYRARDALYVNVFEKGKAEVHKWKVQLFGLNNAQQRDAADRER